MPLWNKVENGITDDKYLIEKIKEGKTLKDLIKDKRLQPHGYYGIAHRIKYWKDLNPEIEKIYLQTRDRYKEEIYKTITLEVPDIWTFGHLADTHLNSKYENLPVLNRVYDKFAERKIKEVFNDGDTLDGWNVYKGQIFYVERIGVNNQVKYAVKVYPKRKGVDTYFIDGNHDNHIYRTSSMRVGEMLDEKRSDMHFIGVYRGDVKVRNTLIRLFHAEGGSIENYSAVRRYLGRLGKQDLPDYLLVGHYHCRDQPVIRGVPCIFGKTTQNITP